MKSKSLRPDGYHSWQGMIQRCEYHHHGDYHNYGGRGIKVCERWRHSFITFMEDMGPRPSKRHSVERIDVNGDYTPDNCRWATWKEQGNNRRTNRMLTFQGRTATMAQWAEEIGLTIAALFQRLTRMSVEKSLTYKPKLLEHDGLRMSATDWAPRVGIKANTIHKRLEQGWTVAEALTTPVRLARGEGTSQ